MRSYTETGDGFKLTARMRNDSMATYIVTRPGTKVMGRWDVRHLVNALNRAQAAMSEQS